MNKKIKKKEPDKILTNTQTYLSRFLFEGEGSEGSSP